ncbi:MAG: hypothetical protein JW779_14050 [Candidatus Thorarchaeota archaeon]|nr:hypothetical protein [Candidatus Thorarchaeota archaeon]
MNSTRRRGIIGFAAFLLVTIGIAIPLALLLQPHQIELTKVGELDVGWAWAVEVEGDIAYVLERDEPTPRGLVIVNVSDPTAPVELGSFHDGGAPMSLDVVSDLVFVADQFEALEIIDVSDPSDPIEVGEYEGSGEIYDVQVVGDLAYVADWNEGLVILNISDPTSPVFLSDYPIIGACVQLYVVENLAYVSDHRSENTGLRVVNVSDPLDPTYAGQFMPTDADLWNPVVVGDYAYMGNHGTGGGEMRILDVSDPAAIEEAGRFEVGGNAILVSDCIAYVAGWTDGLLMVDVSDPGQPVLLARFSEAGMCNDMDVIGDVVYIADKYRGIMILVMSVQIG